MPKVNSACLTKMTQAEKDLNAWKLNWVLGREFYRAQNEPGNFSMAYWDAIAFGNYGKPDFTDGQPALSAYRQQVKSGFESNTPGWNNNTCSLDLPSLACFAFWMASILEPTRILALELMQKNDAEIPLLKEVCPPDVTSDAKYQFDFPVVPGPGDNTVPPVPVDSVPPGLDTLPPGTKTPGGTDTTVPPTPGGIVPVKADDTGTEKKTNWWLWGSIATVVVGGAAFIGLVRRPEIVYDAPAPNPSKKRNPYGHEAKRIGVAIGKPRGSSTRRDHYGIYDDGTVSYEGFEYQSESGKVLEGLPLAGPHAAHMQVHMPFKPENFDEIRYFGKKNPVNVDYKSNDPRGWGGDPSRGAALGRPSVRGPADFAGKLALRRIRLDSGGYDPNGTYFGTGAPLFWYASEDGVIDDMTRAANREAAKAKILQKYPKAQFFR